MEGFKLNKITLLLLILSAVANAEAPQPEAADNGIYIQKLYGLFGYQVDTVTKLCFANNPQHKNGGVTKIDCKDLFLRDEWKPVLNWIKQ
jgi:hypothetical protein